MRLSFAACKLVNDNLKLMKGKSIYVSIVFHIFFSLAAQQPPNQLDFVLVTQRLMLEG